MKLGGFNGYISNGQKKINILVKWRIHFKLENAIYTGVILTKWTQSEELRIADNFKGTGLLVGVRKRLWVRLG